jgi:gluconate 2-dehydrogenase gamma chain
MPPDPEAFRRAMCGLNETARTMSNDDRVTDHGTHFEMLDGHVQDMVLTAVQRGDAAGATWETMPSARWFEELLTELAALYYSHPIAQDEIGYAGYADAHGWQLIGLDELESFEPRPMSE